MNTAAKVGLVATGIGVLYFIGKRASESIDAVKQSLPTLKIVGFGVPKLSNNILTFPLTFEVNNPTQHEGVQLDSVMIHLSLMKENSFQKVAEAVVRDFKVMPGKTRKDFTASIDLRSLSSKLFDTITSAFQNSYIDIRIDIDAIAAGVAAPTQTVTERISLV